MSLKDRGLTGSWRPKILVSSWFLNYPYMTYCLYWILKAYLMKVNYPPTFWNNFWGHWGGRLNGAELMQLTTWYSMCIIYLIQIWWNKLCRLWERWGQKVFQAPRLQADVKYFVSQCSDAISSYSEKWMHEKRKYEKACF